MPRRPVFETLTAEAAQLELKRRIDQDRAHAAAYHEKQTGSGKTRYSRYVPTPLKATLDQLVKAPPPVLAIVTEIIEAIHKGRPLRRELLPLLTEYQTKARPALAPAGEWLAARQADQANQGGGQ